jgi:hypothetical protein
MVLRKKRPSLTETGAAQEPGFRDSLVMPLFSVFRVVAYRYGKLLVAALCANSKRKRLPALYRLLVPK